MSAHHGAEAREVAEQLMIDAHGGVANLENVVNPIGQARIVLMGAGYVR